MKTIITLDKADQPFGFPQLDNQGHLTGSKVYGPFGANSVVSASNAQSASYLIGGVSINTGSFVTTSSFNSFTSSYNTGSFTGSFSGSLFGTASWANAATNAEIANNVYGWANATAGIINNGEVSGYTYSYIVRAEELEQSKHTTVNIFNFLNFS